MPASVRVVSAKESAERDRAAIERGTPSLTLMERAGAAAADEIHRRFPDQTRQGALIYTGPGNNGGDGWVVARSLSSDGFPVRVKEVMEPKTADASAEKEAASRFALANNAMVPAVVVDALLGTGSEGEPRGRIGDAVKEINDWRRRGASIIALDIPTGLDATSGKHGSCVFADLTLSFGAVKRGSLVARDCGGKIVALDIGLDDNGQSAPSTTNHSLPILIDSEWVHSRIPPIHFDAHKGVRKHLALIGGGPGMPGAVVLAARAAFRSGIGLLKVAVSAENLAAVVGAIPSALISTWPDDPGAIARELTSWAHAIVIGPGLGKSPSAERILEALLGAKGPPVLLDADALNAFEGNPARLGALLAGREALLTPHPAEFARLAGVDVEKVLDQRFDIGVELAKKTNATILLKGVPTIVFTPDGARFVVARGSAALGTGGSGDLLAGIAGTLLAQTGSALSAACCAAWIHGRAAELCEYVRGTTLDDVLYALPRVWNEPERGAVAPVLAELPAVTR